MNMPKPKNLAELLHNIASASEWQNKQIVFFLGAGCSRSSGIPGAQALAERWLRHIRKYIPDAAIEFEGLNETDAVKHYFRLFKHRFKEGERNDAIAEFTKAAYPGLGYVIFANLLASSDRWGSKDKKRFKTILTTNFDNLIEQAFILFTPERPKVIPDSSLIEFIGSGSDISIVKVHGDSRYAPKNDSGKVEDISQDEQEKVAANLDKGILIVIGYAGEDAGVAKLISALVVKQKIEQIWWLDSESPGKPVQEEMTKSFEEFFHVKHADFDDFMLRLQNQAISESHVSSTRMYEHIYRYHDRLMWRFGLYGPDGQTETTIDPRKFNDYFRPFAEAAKQLNHSSPQNHQALEILEHYKHNHSQNPNYNIFLGACHKTIGNSLSKAIELFREAKKLAADHAGARAELANALKEAYYPQDNTSFAPNEIGEILAEFRAAEKYDPQNLNNSLNFAGFLLALDDEQHYREGEGKLKDCSEKLYEKKHLMELAFYIFAHRIENIEKMDIYEPLLELKKHLTNKVRSPDFDLRWNIAKAERDNHPHIELVRLLADAIKEKPDFLPEGLLTSINKVLGV